MGGSEECHRLPRYGRHESATVLMRVLGAASIAFLAAWIAGCAGTESVARGRERSAASSQRGLAQAIARQEHRPDRKAITAPPPEGVPAALAEPLTGDALLKSEKSLEAVAAEWSHSTQELATAEDRGRVEEAARLEAVRSYVLGRARRLDGDLARAENDLKQAARLDPHSASIWRELGEVQLLQANRVGATSAFRRAVALDSQDIRSLDALSRAAIERRDSMEAASLLLRLAALDLESFDPAMPWIVDARLGRALLDLGYLGAGVEALESALTLPDRFGDPTAYASELGVLFRQRGDLWRDVGDAVLQCGDLRKAVECYEEATQSPNLNPAALTARLVYCHMRRGNSAAAADLVIREIEEANGRVDERLMGLVRYVSQHSDSGPLLAAAIGQIEANLPEEDRALLSGRLARARAAALDGRAALEALRAQLRDSPADEEAIRDLMERLPAEPPEARLREAVNLIEAASLHESRYAAALLRSRMGARDLLAALGRLPPGIRDKPAARLLRARLLAVSGDLEAADRELESLVTDQPELSAAVVARVGVLIRLGRVDDAALELDRLVESSDPDLRVAKALALSELGDDESALRTIEPIIPAPGVVPRDASPLTFDRLILAARLAASIGRTRDAEGWLLAAVRLDPTRDDAYSGLIVLYARSGPLADEDRLAGIVRSLRDANPSSVTLRSLRAQEAAGRGQLDLAERDLIDLANENPDRAQIVEALVELWKLTGALDRAYDWLSSAGERYPGNSIYPAELAEVLVLLKRRDEAIAMLEERLARAPGDDVASRRLEQILREDPEQRARADQLAEARLARSPRTPEALAELAELSMRRGEYDLALERLQRLFSLERPPRPIVAQRLCQSAADIGNTVAAGLTEVRRFLPILTLLLEKFPDAPPGAYMVALQLQTRSNAPVEELLVSADRASKQHAALRVQAYVLVFSELLQAGRSAERPGPARPQDAVKVLEHACTTLKPPPVELHGLWVVQTWPRFNRTRDPAGFVRAIDVARRTDTIDALLLQVARLTSQRGGRAAPPAEIAYVLALDLNGSEHEELMEWLYRTALRYEPDHLWSNNNLGYRLLTQDRDVDEAARMIERAYATMKADAQVDERGSVTDSMGWARYKQGILYDEVDPENNQVVREGALTLLTRAAELTRNDPRLREVLAIILDHLGDAQWAAGQRDQALATWQEAGRRGQETLEKYRTQPGDLREGDLAEIRSCTEASIAKSDAVAADRQPGVSRIHGPINAPDAPHVPDAREQPVQPPPAQGMQPTSGSLN